MPHSKSTARKTQKATKRPSLKSHLKHTVVPHKGNQFRPHLTRVHGIAVVLIFAMLVQVAYGFVSSGQLEVLGRVSSIDQPQLVEQTNQERLAAGLGELESSPELNQAAQLKAQDMFANNYWAHTSPTGVSPWKWLDDVGYQYSVAGENLAMNYPNADATVAAWMASETHRANILNERYSQVGFAVLDGVLLGQDTTLVVAYYGDPQDLVAVAGSTSAEAAQVTSVGQTGQGLNPLTYLASAVQSVTPATTVAIMLVIAVAIVGLAAHQHRVHLPAAWRKSWRAHHGMYTFVGMIGLAFLMILATGGGTI